MAKFISTDSGVTILSKLNNTIVTIGTEIGNDYVCDGTYDDVQINAAMVAVNAAGGGTILIRKGTYNCAAPVIPLSNITIYGEGKVTEIKQNTTGTHFFHGGNVQNFRMENIYINGNTAIRPGIDSTGGGWAIIFEGDLGVSKHIFLKNVWVYGADFGGVCFGKCLDAHFDGGHIENCPDAAIAFVLGNDGYSANGNWIETSLFGISTSCQGSSAGDIALYGYNRNGVVKNNIIIVNAGVNSCGVEIDGTTDSFYEGNTMTLKTSAGYGFRLDGHATDISYFMQRISVKNNSMYVNTSNPLTVIDLHEANLGDSIIIEGNYIYSPTVVASQTGIYSENNSPCSIIGNHITNMANGITLDSNNVSLNFVVERNKIIGCSYNIYMSGNHANESTVLLKDNKTSGALIADITVQTGYTVVEALMSAPVETNIISLGTLHGQIAVNVAGTVYYIPIYTTGS